MTGILRVASLLAAASAFNLAATPPGSGSRSPALARRATSEDTSEAATATVAPPEEASVEEEEATTTTVAALPELDSTPRVVRPRMGSEWYDLALPFMPRPVMLDGTLAADAGFDPMGLANSKVELYNYREAEIKHARLAMLGAAGWPLAELWDSQLADLFGLPSIIDENGGRDPSVLNGGLGLISPVYWAAVVALTAAIELRGETVKAQRKQADKTWMLSGSWVPGDLGFDPLNLYTALGETPRGKFLMETAELKNGRTAMVAITIFVLEEFFTGKPVVDLTPIFFEPFPKVVEDLMFAAPPLYSLDQQF